MSNFILAVKNNRDELRLNFSCNLGGVLLEDSLKIDTGASKTLIPLKSISYVDRCDLPDDDVLLSGDFYKLLKQQYLNADIPHIFMKGVERIDYPSNTPLIDRRDIVFREVLKQVNLEGYILPKNFEVYVNCDTTGNILLGMDILQFFDFHCGLSKVLNNYVFIGVLRTQEDKSDYYRALEEHFGFYSDVKDVIVDLAVKDEKLKDLSVGYRECVVNKVISTFLGLFKK